MFVERIKSNKNMDLYLIIFASGNYKAEKRMNAIKTSLLNWKNILHST